MGTIKISTINIGPIYWSCFKSVEACRIAFRGPEDVPRTWRAFLVGTRSISQ